MVTSSFSPTTGLSIQGRGVLLLVKYALKKSHCSQSEKPFGSWAHCTRVSTSVCRGSMTLIAGNVVGEGRLVLTHFPFVHMKSGYVAGVGFTWSCCCPHAWTCPATDCFNTGLRCNNHSLLSGGPGPPPLDHRLHAVLPSSLLRTSAWSQPLHRGYLHVTVSC